MHISKCYILWTNIIVAIVVNVGFSVQTLITVPQRSLSMCWWFHCDYLMQCDTSEWNPDISNIHRASLQITYELIILPIMSFPSRHIPYNDVLFLMAPSATNHQIHLILNASRW